MSYSTESTATIVHRDVTIDIAKGLCILLVVCIHSEVFSFVPMPVEFVAVPMFFFMSGCFDRSSRPFSSVVVKGLRTLVFPACVWTLVSGLYLGVLKVAKGEPPLFHFDLFTPCTTNGPCWFLVALFWTRLLMWLLERAFRPKALQAAVVVLLGWLGFRQLLPLYFDDALVALPPLLCRQDGLRPPEAVAVAFARGSVAPRGRCGQPAGLRLPRVVVYHLARHLGRRRLGGRLPAFLSCGLVGHRLGVPPRHVRLVVACPPVLAQSFGRTDPGHPCGSFADVPHLGRSAEPPDGERLRGLDFLFLGGVCRDRRGLLCTCRLCPSSLSPAFRHA